MPMARVDTSSFGAFERRQEDISLAFRRFRRASGTLDGTDARACVKEER